MPASTDFNKLSSLPQFTDVSNLSEVQQFLERFQKSHLEWCLASDSYSAEQREFFVDVANLTGESVEDVTSMFCKAVDELVIHVMGIQEFSIQQEQAKQRIEKVQEFFAKSKQGKKHSQLQTKRIDFEKELLIDVVEGLYHQLSELYERWISIFNAYWQYLPVGMQEGLLRWVELQIGSCEDAPEGSPEEYQASFLRLKDAFAKAKKMGITKLSFRVSSSGRNNKLDANLSTNEKLDTVDVLSPPKRKYTLEELLEGVTPENSHEATDWGPPVGEEFW
jgi:antitoxin MazE